MQEYEYIVLGDDGRRVLVVAQVHLNDSTAIRSAAALADGRGFEVWRDLDCIDPKPSCGHYCLTA